jgi:hypothetical protein
MTNPRQTLGSAAHTAKANQLAQALGYSPAEAQTYREPRWQDAHSNVYASKCRLMT